MRLPVQIRRLRFNSEYKDKGETINMGIVNVKKLSDCEEMVMRVIWESNIELESVSIQNIFNKKFNKEWKIQTVLTILMRLQKKRWLDIQGDRRCHRYIPTVSYEDYRKEKLKEVLELFDDSHQELIQIIDEWMKK